MKRLRFPLVALCALAAADAFAQAGPPVKIKDIQVSEADGAVKVLVTFSAQPVAASVKAEGDALVIDVDGVALAPFSLDPQTGNLIGHVSAEPSGDGGSLLTLSGAALSKPAATIYRNAVMIEAELIEPKLAGVSLLSRTPPAAPSKLPPVPHAPDPPPAPEPLLAGASPIQVAALTGADAARCTAAATQVKADPWALNALGEHALCLVDAGRLPEARDKLDQLAAFAPEDWRVALGRAALAGHDGDLAKAEAGFTSAALLATDAGIREAIAKAAKSFADRRTSAQP